MSKLLEIHIDGACSGNPGESGIGIVIVRNGRRLSEISQSIGEGTNNIAEYTALIFALQEALILKAKQVKVFTDSELVYKQVTGGYKVKDPKIKILFMQVKHLISGFEDFKIQHIPREENKDADALARSGIRKGQTEMGALLFENSGEESPSSKG